MPVYYDSKRKNWYVVYRIKDATGKEKQSTKRGFPKKRDATAWENEFNLKRDTNMDMSFKSLCEIYLDYAASRNKPTTYITKENIINNKILPYFKNKKVSEITLNDVGAWQNEMIKSGMYAPSYLRQMHSQLSAIFNYAIKHYKLKKNPAKEAGTMGSKKAKKKMVIWTPEEYKKFSFAIMDNIISFYAFEMLFWIGIRLGELLALTPADFDFKNNTVTIDKNLQHIKGQDIILPPKTEKSERTISLPQFLSEEIKEYIDSLYKIEDSERIFNISKSTLHREMTRGSKASGVKRIPIHNLRHSHISLLIHMGYTAVDIGDRVGHESPYITFHYGHIFQAVKREMANDLDNLRNQEA